MRNVLSLGALPLRPGMLALGLALAGCGQAASSQVPPPEAHAAAPITNRVEVPAAVRQSLGITFAQAEERAVSRTVRLACHVDSAPDARRPYHTNVAGTLTMHVAPFEEVEADQLLASVTSPELLEHRHELHLAADAVGEANDAARVVAALHKEATANLAFVRTRLDRLGSGGATLAELEARREELGGRVGVLAAQRNAARRALVRAEHRFEAELASFATRVGIPVAALRAEDTSSADHGQVPPRWETLSRLELRARSAGVVSRVPHRSGTWISQGGEVLEVADPGDVQVACRALMSDLGRLATGQAVSVVPAGRMAGSAPKPVRGSLRLGVAADEQKFTVPALVTPAETAEWLRPGVSVFADVAVSGSAGAETAIPSAALIRDGLETVFFRRDPADTDKVIRTAADIGASDDLWTVVFSGVAPGDEVVIDGAYELKLASTRKPDAVGHFHADGTFHEGTD